MLAPIKDLWEAFTWACLVKMNGISQFVGTCMGKWRRNSSYQSRLELGLSSLRPRVRVVPEPPLPSNPHSSSWTFCTFREDPFCGKSKVWLLFLAPIRSFGSESWCLSLGHCSVVWSILGRLASTPPLPPYQSREYLGCRRAGEQT